MYMCWGSNLSPPEKIDINLFQKLYIYDGHQRDCIPIQKTELEEKKKLICFEMHLVTKWI